MKRKRLGLKLSPTQIIAIVFALIILSGTLLLMLPEASQSGESCGFLDALFTATSATCVTGLIPFDTGTNWSTFGQVVIITMIEIGGLGFMSVASLVVFLLRRRVGLKQRMVMAQALSLDEMDSVVKLQKWVLGGSLSIQLSAALVLFFRFLPQFGAGRAAWYGVFHAISAFCNAGFDIFGYGDSIVQLNRDPVVCLTLMLLVTVGGLGFFVWEEVVRVRSFKKFSVYTKMVLLASLVLTSAGTAAFCLLEWNRPTMAGMDAGTKLLNGLYQSVTVRTAGFDAIGQGALCDASKGVSMVLMLIGGSSGSTAGGIKTVTVGVLLLTVWSSLRGREQVVFRGRTIPARKVLDAVTLTVTVFVLLVLGSMALSVLDGVPMLKAAYEVASALGTVGLSMGLTPGLSAGSSLLIILYMFLGRVGILSFSIAFLIRPAESKLRYPDAQMLIG